MCGSVAAIPIPCICAGGRYVGMWSGSFRHAGHMWGDPHHPHQFRRTTVPVTPESMKVLFQSKLFIVPDCPSIVWTLYEVVLFLYLYNSSDHTCSEQLSVAPTALVSSSVWCLSGISLSIIRANHSEMSYTTIVHQTKIFRVHKLLVNSPLRLTSYQYQCHKYNIERV